MPAPYDPFFALKKRQEMMGASSSYSLPVLSSPILAARTIVNGILEAADAERELNLLSRQAIDHSDGADGSHGEEEEKEGQWQRQATVDPQRASPLPHGKPFRRPVRPFTKRATAAAAGTASSCSIFARPDGFICLPSEE